MPGSAIQACWPNSQPVPQRELAFRKPERAAGAAMEGKSSAAVCSKQPLRRLRTASVVGLMALAALAAAALLITGAMETVQGCSISRSAVQLASLLSSGTANRTLSNAVLPLPVARGRTLVMYIYGGSDPGEVVTHSLPMASHQCSRARCWRSPHAWQLWQRASPPTYCCRPRAPPELMRSACQSPSCVQSTLRTSVSLCKRRSGQVGHQPLSSTVDVLPQSLIP